MSNYCKNLLSLFEDFDRCNFNFSYSEPQIKSGKWNFPAAYDKHVWRSRVLDQCAMCIRVWEHELERRTHVRLLINEILALLRCEMRATSSKEKRIRYDINKRVISSTNTEKILQEKDLLRLSHHVIYCTHFLYQRSNFDQICITLGRRWYTLDLIYNI